MGRTEAQSSVPAAADCATGRMRGRQEQRGFKAARSLSRRETQRGCVEFQPRRWSLAPNATNSRKGGSSVSECRMFRQRVSLDTSAYIHIHILLPERACSLEPGIWNQTKSIKCRMQLLQTTSMKGRERDHPRPPRFSGHKVNNECGRSFREQTNRLSDEPKVELGLLAYTPNPTIQSKREEADREQISYPTGT